MNSLIVVLLIQCGLLLLMVLAGLILTVLNKENKIQKRVFSILTSLLLVVLAIVNFSLFLSSYYASSIVQIKDTVPLLTFYTYSFEIGIQATLSQIIIYMTSMFILAVTNCYLSWKKPYWKEIHSGKIALYGLSLIFLILSPNLFQILFFLLFSDLLLINLIKGLILRSRKLVPNSMKKMIVSFLIGDTLILTASILLAKIAKSLDFRIIINNIETNPDLYETHIQLIISLLLLGIIIKNSLFPFHTWFKEISSSNEDTIFAFLSLHFVLTFSFIFITPISQIILVQGSTFYIWYGLILALVGIVFALFLTKELETSILIYTVLSGMIIFVLGLGELSIAFQILVIFPVLLVGLVPYQFTINLVKEEAVDQAEKFNIGIIIARFFFFVVLTGVFLGVAPLSSTFLVLVKTLYSTSLIFNIGLFVFFLFLSYGIFGLVIKIYKKQIKFATQFRFSILEILYTGSIVIFLSLNSTLYPVYNLINPFSYLPILEINVVWIPLVVLFSGGILILITFLVIKKYFTNVDTKLAEISMKIETFLRPIYSFDFIFAPICILWVEAILPRSKWFVANILEKFLFEIVILNVWKSILFASKWIGKIIRYTVIPYTVQIFKSISDFIRKLEQSKLRTQIQIVLISLSLLISIILILYSGGVI